MGNKIEKQESSVILKKAISLFLSLVILFSITAGLDISVYAKVYTYSGNCGDNVTYNFNTNTGNLSISGKGKMKNFSNCSAPWSSNRSEIKTITIDEGVSSIGTFAFYFCRNLTTIEMPNTIESIQDNAFNYCDSLTDVIIPNSTKSMGAWSFANCTDLRNVVIGSSLTNIGKYSFYNCVNLELIKIGNRVESINSSAFENCSNLANLKIPSSVKVIDSYAFDNCSNLESITIENPNCEFPMFGKVIPKHSTIYGYKYSTAETYAKENGNEFIALKCTHIWNNGVITDTPTCTQKGTLTYTCTVCGGTKTESIKATEKHIVVIDKSVLSTCTTAGKTEGSHCVVCNAVITAQKAVPATGHSYDAGKITKQPTVTTAGVKTYTCTKCKATKTEAIKATGLKTPTLKATVNANGTFKLSWNKVSGAEKYELYIKQADGSYKLMKTTTATSFTTAFATYGKQFSYKMRAVKGNTKSAYSSVVNAKNTKKLQTPTMKVTVNANGTFKLSWNKVSGAEKYELYIKQANGSYKLMKTTTSTSFTTAFATYGKQFSYKMRAVTSKNKSAASAYSSVVNAKNTKKLQTPSLKVTVNKNGSFKLSWGKVAGATSYQIYMKQANGSYKLMKTTSSTSFTTAVAAKGKTYSYKIKAVTSKNKNAASNYSNTVSAKRK